ncbi:MAG: secretin and TonB N-terminal domain-containing protein, partial [Haliea sp.]
MARTVSVWARILALALLVSGLPAGRGLAASGSPPALASAAGSQEQALRAIARETGVQIIFSSELVENLASPGLQGRFTLDAALQAALAGTGL